MLCVCAVAEADYALNQVIFRNGRSKGVKKDRVKTIKLVSVCLVTVLMASLFLISGVSGTDTDSNLSSVDDNITVYAEDYDSRSANPTPGRGVVSAVKTGQMYGYGGVGPVGKYGAQIA